MLYAGATVSGGSLSIGYATSDDGLLWTRSTVNPIISKLTAGLAWDVYGDNSPVVSFLPSGELVGFFTGHPVDKRPRMVRIKPTL